VVVTRKLPDSTETRMRELFDTRLNLDDTPMTQAQLAEAVRSADILVPTVSDEITADILNQPDVRLKLIANFGNGVDNIDVAAAMARGIMVTNTPKVLTEDTADMTMALLLAVPRRLIEGASILTEGKDWPGWSPTWMLGHRLGGKRLGIIGMGRIGRRWRAAPTPSGCRFTITTAARSRRRSRKSWARPIGTASTRCWRGWISFR
jgi:glyoxylate reductase